MIEAVLFLDLRLDDLLGDGQVLLVDLFVLVLVLVYVIIEDLAVCVEEVLHRHVEVWVGNDG